MVWAQKNTLNEGHVFVVQGVFDPKQLNIKTSKEISRNDRYLKEYSTLMLYVCTCCVCLCVCGSLARMYMYSL